MKRLLFCLSLASCGLLIQVNPPNESGGQCADNIDNDNDQAIDCQDEDCSSETNCSQVESNCIDGLDDDGDELIDCADPDCANGPDCQEAGNCQDGLDNDGDDLADCADPDCANEIACVGNLPPVAADDNFNATEDEVLALASSSLLKNDSDPNPNTTLTIIDVQPVTGGDVVLSNGNVIFTPTPDFNGDASFTYTIDDNNGGQDSATVTVDVSSVNDLPAPLADTIGTNQGIEVSIPVLNNDSGLGDGGIVVLLDSLPANGVALVLGDNSILYTPDADFFGVESFSYEVSDIDGDTAVADITVTVDNVDSTPVALDDSATVAEDGTTETAVLANDQELLDGNMIVTLLQPPLSGVAVINANNTISYTPDADFFGDDSYTYQVRDADGDTDTALVSVTINAVNDQPIAVGDGASLNEDSGPIGVDVLVNDVLGNNPLVGDQPVSISIQSGPSNGNAAVVGEQIRYTPNPNFSGLDTIVYQLSDVDNDQDTATVTITVIALEDAPTANDDTASTNEDTATDINVLLNDVDPDGNQTLEIISLDNAFNGSAQTIGNLVRFTPDPNVNGPGGFSYTITDGTSFSTANVTVNIGPVNDAPSAADDTAGTNEDTLIEIAVLTGDTDIDGGALSVTATSNVLNGTTAIVGNLVRFTPTTNLSGIGSFDYTISDGNGGTDTGSVTVNINAIADQPNLSANNVSGPSGTIIPLEVNASLVDTDGSESLEVVLSGVPQTGSLSAGAVVAAAFSGFNAAVNFAAGDGPVSVAVGRFNDDDADDFVVANQASNNISVFLNNGAGSFTRANFAAGIIPSSVTTGRINGDPFDDIAVTNGSGNNVSVFLNNGAGSFGAATNFAVESGPTDVAVGQFNGDAFSDLVVTNRNTDNISILFGNGAGGFGGTIKVTVGDGPVGVDIGRFNGDAFDDIAVANGTSNNLSVIFSDGAGGFSTAVNFAGSAGPTSVEVGRFNADAFDDVAVSNFNANVSIFLGTGSGGFLPFTNFSTGGAPFNVTTTDLNGDSLLDLAFANFSSSMIFMLGNGDGTFGAPSSVATGSTSRVVAAGQFNADGVPDLVVANENSDNASVLISRGSLLTFSLLEPELSGLTFTPAIGAAVLTLNANAIATEASNGSQANRSVGFTVNVTP